MAAASSILRKSRSLEYSLIPILIGPICPGVRHVGLMIDSFNFLSVADLNPVRYNFKSVFQFRPYIGVFNAIPSFIKKLGWKTVFFISETFQLYDLIEDNISKGLYANNITVGGNSKVVWTDSSKIPEYQYYLAAALQLKQNDARIVVLLTGFPTSMSCAMYEVGMYGPKYVFIWEGVMYFQSNDPLKPPNCTEHALAEILRSSIFVSQAMPINLDPDFVDEIGMTPRRFDEMMEKKLNMKHPQTIKTWFQWRSTFYSQLVGTALVLDRTDKILKTTGGSIGEWLTDGNNFQANGSFIRNLLHDQFSTLKYKGLSTYGNNEITKPVLEAGFHQLQQENTQSDEAFDFQPVPVAYSPADTEKLVFMKPFQWKTKNNKIPVSAISKIEKSIPLLPDATKYIFLVLSLASLSTTIGVAIYHLIRMKNPDDSLTDYGKNSEKFNFSIAIGNALGCIFIVILSSVDYPSSVACSIASVLLIGSQWITGIAILAKVEIAKGISLKKRVRIDAAGVAHKKVSPRSNNRISKDLPSTNSLSKPRGSNCRSGSQDRAFSFVQIQNEKIQTTIRNYWRFLASCSTVFIVMAIVWFIVDPLKSERVFLKLEILTKDDVHFEYISKTCVASGQSFNALLAAFLSPYFILIIRMIQVGFLTKHIKNLVVNEIVILRTVSYTIPSISFFGIAIIILLFISQPVYILTSVLALIFILLFVNIGFQIYSTLKLANCF